jgi:hypothetical protein
VYEELRKRLHLAKRDIPLHPFKVDPNAAAVEPVVADAEEDSRNDPLAKLLKAADSQQSSPIRVDEEDNVDVVNNAVPHIGPIESKLIQGSDGRTYALELMRLTPRDANYVAVSIFGKKFLLNY